MRGRGRCWRRWPRPTRPCSCAAGIWPGSRKKNGGWFCVRPGAWRSFCGWVILSFSHRDGRLVNQWAADHTMSLTDATPILVMDMYEHAYAIDYGAKAAAYVDAFMAAIQEFWLNAPGVVLTTAKRALVAACSATTSTSAAPACVKVPWFTNH